MEIENKQAESEIKKNSTEERARRLNELKGYNIYQKLSCVSRKCESVYKDGKVNGPAGFKYATAGNIISMVNENLFVSRLAVYVNYKLIKLEMVDITGRDGTVKTAKFATVEATATIVNVDNPDEKIQVSAFGCGQDYGDTAIGKAQTYALKYLWVTTLQIQQLDDPEKDFEENQNAIQQKVRG